MAEPIKIGEIKGKMMCPKCHTQIHKLIAYKTYYTAFPDTTLYICPECHAILASNEEEAKALFHEPEQKHEHKHKARA